MSRILLAIWMAAALLVWPTMSAAQDAESVDDAPVADVDQPVAEDAPQDMPDEQMPEGPAPEAPANGEQPDEGQPPANGEAPGEAPTEQSTVAPTPTPAPTAVAPPPIELPEVPIVNGPNPDGMVMNFKDAPLELVLREMSEKLGLVIIDGNKSPGRVNLLSRQPLSVDEAVSALNSALKSNNLTAVRTGRSLRIIPIEQAKQSNIPVRSASDLPRLTDTDVMVTQVIAIRYADADKLRTDIAQLIPAYAHLASNVASNTLIYTATEADVKHLAQIVRALDVQLAEADTVKVFRLEFADATNTATLIEKVFNQDGAGGTTSSRNSQRGGFFGRGFRPDGGGQQNAEATTNTVRQQKVSAAADRQTNAVVVTAPPEIMGLIAEVVKEIDENPVAEESIFVYPLTYAKASELEPVLQNIFSSSSTGTTGGRGTTGRTSTRGSFVGRGSTAANTTSEAIGDLAGKVYIVAEEDTNSLLVRTAPKYFDRVKAILKDLDRGTRQVLIKVLIAEVTHDDDLDLGVEFSVLNLNIGRGEASVATDFGIGTLTSGLVTKFVSTDFQATIRALQKIGKLDVLSRPYLLASENQEASITVGEEVPYITNSRVTDAGQTVNTVEYRDIGIILNVTPYIGPDGMVIMDVDQEISSLTGRTITVSEDFDAEIYAKRSAQTRVAVANGQTVVIGGLMQDRITQTDSKVPLLGDIPLIGGVFRRNVKEKSKTELLIFLCPQTALNPEELQAISDKTKSHGTIVHDAVEPGSLERGMNELQLPDQMKPNGQAPAPEPTVKEGL